MSTFRRKFWLVCPASAHVNEKLAQHFMRLDGDRSESGVPCSNGSRKVLHNGWRADLFDELKVVLRSFTGSEISVFRCAENADVGVPWRRGLLKALPRRARYSRKPAKRGARMKAKIAT